MNKLENKPNQTRNPKENHQSYITSLYKHYTNDIYNENLSLFHDSSLKKISDEEYKRLNDMLSLYIEYIDKGEANENNKFDYIERFLSKYSNSYE